MKVIIDDTENGFIVTIRRGLFIHTDRFVFENSEKMVEFIKSQYNALRGLK